MSPQIQHTLFDGTTGYGKSECCLSMNVPRMQQPAHPAFMWFDPPGNMANKVESFCISLGKHVAYPPRLIVDRVGETSGVPGYSVLTPSTNPDPEQREAENREEISETKSLLVKDEGKLDTSANPIIDRGIEDALMLFIYQKVPVPFWRLWRCFNPAYEEYHIFLANCSDPDTAARFLWYGRLSERDREFHCGAAERRLRKVCQSPQFRKRCLPTFDLAAFLNAGGVWIGNGVSRGNLSRQDLRLIFGMIILLVIRLARTGKLKKRVVLIIDEGLATGLIEGHLIRAMMEARQWNLEIQIIVQDPMTLPEHIRDNIFHLCSRHFHFRQNSPKAAAVVADIVGTPNLNPLKVKVTEYFKRIVDLGQEAIPTEGRTVWRDSDGQSHESIHKGITYRPVRGEEEVPRDVLFNFQEQLKLKEQEIRTIGIGWCHILDGNSVTETPVKIPMLLEPWTRKDGRPLFYDIFAKKTLASKKHDLAWEVMRGRPEYQTPQVVMPCQVKKDRKTGME